MPLVVRSTEVIVVGGGIAGLAAAYDLARLRVPFVLLEARSRPGGVILSEEIEGYTVDAGPDSLLVQKPDAIALCEELGLGERLVPTTPPRIAFVQRDGRLHPLPAFSVLGIPTRFGPFLRSGLFSWQGKLRIAAEVFVPPRREEDDESIGAFMTRRFGREATTYLAEPLLAGIHAGDVNRLSVGALFPRFREAERSSGSLLRAFRSVQHRHGPAAAAEGGAFRSLPSGLSELVRALVAVLPRGSVCLNTAVTRVVGSVGPSNDVLSTNGHRPFRVETSTGDALEARAIVLATPAFVTTRLVRQMDGELAGLCDEVAYASTATVVLAFARAAVAHPLEGSGFVVPRVEGTGILAASWLSSKWPGRAPAGHVLLRTFVGGARDRDALELGDDDLMARSLRALTPLLGITGPPLFSRVYRWERGSAQHEVGHLARMAAIERTLGRHPGLYLTGSGFRGVGIPDCIADGRATARQVATKLGAVT
jgi:oxygen-dependent protoporphyrinogen oxidase